MNLCMGTLIIYHSSDEKWGLVRWFWAIGWDPHQKVNAFLTDFFRYSEIQCRHSLNTVTVQPLLLSVTCGCWHISLSKLPVHGLELAYPSEPCTKRTLFLWVTVSQVFCYSNRKQTKEAPEYPSSKQTLWAPSNPINFHLQSELGNDWNFEKGTDLKLLTNLDRTKYWVPIPFLP